MKTYKKQIGFIFFILAIVFKLAAQELNEKQCEKLYETGNKDFINNELLVGDWFYVDSGERTLQLDGEWVRFKFYIINQYKFNDDGTLIENKFIYGLDDSDGFKIESSYSGNYKLTSKYILFKGLYYKNSYSYKMYKIVDNDLIFSRVKYFPSYKYQKAPNILIALESYQQGLIAEKAGDFSKAITEYTKALELEKTYKYTRYNYVSNKLKYLHSLVAPNELNTPKAVAQYIKELEKNPSDEFAYVNLSAIYKKDPTLIKPTDLDGVLASLRKDKNSSLKFINLYELQTQMYVDLKEYSKALTSYKELNVLYKDYNPRSEDGHYNEKIKSVEIDSIKQTANNNPNDAKAQYNCGYYLYTNKDYEQAVEYFEKVANIDPNYKTPLKHQITPSMASDFGFIIDKNIEVTNFSIYFLIALARDGWRASCEAFKKGYNIDILSGKNKDINLKTAYLAYIAYGLNSIGEQSEANSYYKELAKVATLKEITAMKANILSSPTTAIQGTWKGKDVAVSPRTETETYWKYDNGGNRIGTGTRTRIMSTGIPAIKGAVTISFNGNNYNIIIDGNSDKAIKDAYSSRTSGTFKFYNNKILLDDNRIFEVREANNIIYILDNNGWLFTKQ